MTGIETLDQRFIQPLLPESRGIVSDIQKEIDALPDLRKWLGNSSCRVHPTGRRI